MSFPFSQRWLAILLSVTLFVGATVFYSRHNDFPTYYHPDEPLKGEQIITGQYNAHHPLLLLDTAGLILRCSSLVRTPENAIICGRWASAIFSGLSLLSLTILAGRRAGWWGAVLAALLIGLHPLLYELAHYCKEDPALLLGISLTLLALDFFSEKPTLIRATLLGAACGIAISGKYLGVVMLLVALPWVIWRGKRGGIVGSFFAGLIATILLINLPFLLDVPRLIGAFRYELNAAQVGGAKGLTRDVPHAKYLSVFLDNIGWPLWLGIACFIAGWIFQKRERRLSDLVCLVLPVTYTLLLSFSPKTANRYFLAVSPLLILCGSIGLAWLGRWLTNRQRWLGIAVLLTIGGLALWQQWILTIPNVRSFRTDSRMEMATWISSNLPANSGILAESRVCLTKADTWKHTKPREDLKISEKVFASDFGSYQKLISADARYVAVIRTSFGGYLSEKRKASKSLESQHERRQTFYEDLFSKGRLLKKTGGSGVSHLNPEIRLYELPTVSMP